MKISNKDKMISNGVDATDGINQLYRNVVPFALVLKLVKLAEKILDCARGDTVTKQALKGRMALIRNEPLKY